VNAKDKATSKEQNITITNSSGLSQNEVDQMVDDAEAHEAEDTRRREGIEAKNQLDTLIYSTEKSLAEYKDKLDESDISELESAVEEAKKAMAEHGDDKDKLTETTEMLTKAAHKLAEIMYKEASAAGGAPGANGTNETATPGSADSGSNDDDFIDAEVVDE
jgi:molecular chaperone DnaK